MKKRSEAKPQTQLEVALSSVKLLKEVFPQLDAVHQRLGNVLNDAQNDPPHGERDGSIGEQTYNQLRSIDNAIRDLLVSTLFVRVL